MDGYSVARLYGKQKPSIQPVSIHSFLFGNERVRLAGFVGSLDNLHFILMI